MYRRKMSNSKPLDASLACGFHGPKFIHFLRLARELAVSRCKPEKGPPKLQGTFSVTASSCGLLRSKASLAWKERTLSPMRLGAFHYEVIVARYIPHTFREYKHIVISF
jgi:hypothetical protein